MELTYLFRLLVATFLGIAIGLERKLSLKEAGMRTHSIVSLGACLMMLISLYAFDSEADAARVAAQIVSGIGFLGAGMIMFKNHGAIRGLTTAAGIWVTAGVGMAVGAGEYHLAAGATILVILVHCIFHLPFKFFRTKNYTQLNIVFNDGENNVQKVKNIFNIENFTKFKVFKENGVTKYIVEFSTKKLVEDDYIAKVLKENEFIDSIDSLDNE